VWIPMLVICVVRWQLYGSRAYMYVCMYVCMHIYVGWRMACVVFTFFSNLCSTLSAVRQRGLYACVYVCMYVIHGCICVYVYMCMHVFVTGVVPCQLYDNKVRMYTYVYLCVYVCAYVCVYTYVLRVCVYVFARVCYWCHA